MHHSLCGSVAVELHLGHCMGCPVKCIASPEIDSSVCRRMHSIDKAALYEDGASERSMHHSLGSSVTVSREAFELLRLKDRALDNTKEGITIADCRQVFILPMIVSLLPGQRYQCMATALPSGRVLS